MMVLKTVVVSTFVAGTFAATDDTVIHLGSAYKLGRIDTNPTESGRDIGKKGHHRSFQFNRETSCIAWPSMSKGQGPFRVYDFPFYGDSVELEESGLFFNTKYGSNTYFGVHIPIYKQSRKTNGSCVLSLAFTEKKLRKDFLDKMMECVDKKHSKKMSHYKGVVAHPTTGTKVKAKRLSDGQEVFGLGQAIKGKIKKCGDGLPADWSTDIGTSVFGSVEKREFYYQPKDHCIGFEGVDGTKPAYKAFKILDQRTQDLNALKDSDGNNVGTIPFVDDSHTYYIWTIVVEKNFGSKRKPKLKPAYLRLLFQDMEDVNSFKQIFTHDAAYFLAENTRKHLLASRPDDERFASAAISDEEIEAKVVKVISDCRKQWPAIYGTGKAAHKASRKATDPDAGHEEKCDYQGDQGPSEIRRRRLMTRRRLALERLYPRANSN